MTAIDTSRSSLALYGGTPVRDPGRAWPRWPVPAPEAEANLLSVLHGDRWTLTSPITGTALFERRFARLFAEYTGPRHCLPADHRSGPLLLALEPLRLQHRHPVPGP